MDRPRWQATTGSLSGLREGAYRAHGSDIAGRINHLFQVLDTAPTDRSGFSPELAPFRYVNGGIFKEHITLPDLDGDFRDAILAAAAVDWSTISPAIFGSMFQSVRDSQTRRKLGEHYTSEENILKTLNPLFLDELRADFDAAANRETSAKKVNALRSLWQKLGDIRYLDPACGCGNFIIVAYRELRDLELRIMDALATLTEGVDAVALEADWTNSLKVTLDHFYGIEIDEWPARIAETAMFLMDRQCDLKMRERFGIAPERLPLQRSAKIVVGNALRLEWPTMLAPSSDVVIAGNPPFLGHKERTPEQGEDLRAAWGLATIGHLDYVTAWYAKTIKYFGDSTDGGPSSLPTQSFRARPYRFCSGLFTRRDGGSSSLTAHFNGFQRRQARPLSCASSSGFRAPHNALGSSCTTHRRALHASAWRKTSTHTLSMPTTF